jgi:uncharacterized membrane protein (DUF106 family)
MTSFISIFNTVCTFLFGLVYSVVKWLGPFWSLVVLSLLGGVFMVWLFGKVSNQEKIKSTRSRMSAELIGLRLFKDDLRVFFRIQFDILVWTLRYFKYSLIPMAIIMIPVITILTQLNLHYASRPLDVGEQTLVKVKLNDKNLLSQNPEITLNAGDGLVVETKGVRIPGTGEIAWRVRGATPGNYDLVVGVGDETVSKKLAVGGRREGVSTLRSGDGWLTNYLYPGEAPIPRQSAVRSIEVAYPELEISIFGWGVNWLILFFVLSMVFGFALKDRLGVSI